MCHNANLKPLLLVFVVFFFYIIFAVLELENGNVVISPSSGITHHYAILVDCFDGLSLACSGILLIFVMLSTLILCHHYISWPVFLVLVIFLLLCSGILAYICHVVNIDSLYHYRSWLVFLVLVIFLLQCDFMDIVNSMQVHSLEDNL